MYTIYLCHSVNNRNSMCCEVMKLKRDGINFDEINPINGKTLDNIYVPFSNIAAIKAPKDHDNFWV